MKKSSGFTLIELAIVLVIIGLLLGGVLKGQELINSAKAKNIANDLKSTQILLYGYQDKFRSLPGDDAAANTHLTNGQVATTGGTVGNGRIEGQWNSETITEETYLFWQHVRLAGLATGSAVIGDNAFIPRNSDGGRLGIQSLTGFDTITDANTGNNPMVGAFVVCSGGITGRIAKQIDVQLDDGQTNNGNIRVVADGTKTASLANSAVPDGSTFTLCMSF